MIDLPAVLALPTTPKLNAEELSAAFDGASRARLYWWRRFHDFPKSVRVGRTTLTETAEVAAWLTARGIKVTWI